jgi:type IV pilus assembly protein PilW
MLLSGPENFFSGCLRVFTEAPVLSGQGGKKVLDFGAYTTRETATMKNSKGFTIVELLVAIAITGIVMAGVYSVYYAQQKSALVQEQMAAMQQNLRAALYFLEREIRIAGYNPERTAAAGIVAMNNTNIRITMDLHDGVDNDGDGDTDEPDEEGNGDGDILDPGEDVTYLLLDPDGDGIFGLFKRDNVSGIDVPIAENVDALDFRYFDEDRNPAAAPDDVRSVQISIVARAGRNDPGYTDTDTYFNQQGATILAAQNDQFRRRQLSAEVLCRNMGVL